MAERSKSKVCGRSFGGIAGSISAGGMDVSVVCCECCQVEVAATGRSLVQRSLWCVSVCDLESSKMRRP